MATFLLIEDNPDHTELVAHGLRRVGAELRKFANGTDALGHLEALSAQERAGIAAVLLDLQLGRERGLDVLSDIRARGWNVPVIVLTTSDAPRDRERAYELSANSYLVKPLHFDEFQTMVSQLSRYWGRLNRTV